MALEVDLARLISVEEDYSCIKTQQSESNTEMEILKETLSDFNTLKLEHETNLTENADLKSKIANLESSLSIFQNLQDDHNKLITSHRENKYQCESLEKRSIEFDDLKQTHKKLQIIHDDSERKLKHVKEILVEFENLKHKHSEIVQLNKNLENQVVKMIKPGDHKDVLQKLNLSQSKVTRLEKEVTEIAEQTLHKEETKHAVKIKSLESTIEQFSTLQEEYKSLLKIHHAANQTISDLESELLQLENNSSNHISISTQTDYLSDVSFESAVFTESSDNDSPTHKPKLNKTEDRTSFKDVLFQPKHSISTTSKLTSNDSTSVERKSFILSKPKSIGLPNSRYSISSDNSTKELEDKVRQLQGDNSRLRDDINKKEKVIQNYQEEMKNATRNLKDIYTFKEPNKGLKITRSKTGDITELERNSGEIFSQRCNGNHRDFESKIKFLQTEVQLFRDKISSLEQSNKELNDRLKNNSKTSTKKSASPEGDRFKSNFLKSKIKFFESGPTEEKADTMLDKPEDVLRQQIADMEVLRQQVTDLENDRDKLHDNARRDKQIIHNQHIQINELQLSEKMLKEQVHSLSHSERELYEKCSSLEDQVAKQEDEIHELQVLEKRLRELVRKLKLDEESWMTKSDNMLSNMEDLTNSEAMLKSKISDLEKENSKLSDKTQYFELRIKELESSEMNLIQKVKHYENMESKLETKLKDLQNSQDAANSQATELDIVSTDLEKNLAHALEENNMLARHVTELRVQMQEIDRQLLKSKDNEVGLKLHVDSLEKSEIVLHRRIKEFELRDIDAHAFNRELQQSMSILKDRNSALQRSENRMKYRILEIEAGDVQGSTNPKQGKLPERVEDCHQRILQLQNIVATLQRSVDENGNHNNRHIQDRELWEETERQMEELEKLNHQLNSLVEKERNGKEISGREVDLAKLNRKLESYQDFLYRLKQHLLTMRGPSSEHPDTGAIQDSNEVRRQNLQSKETKRVMQTVRGLTTYTEELMTVQGDHIGSLDNSHKRQSDDKILKRSDVQAHEEQIKRDTSGVFTSPLMKSVSQEVKQRLVHNKVGIIESSNSVSSKPEGRWTNSKSAKPAHADKIDVSIVWESVAKATSLSQPHQRKGEEELIIGLTLPSESECQSTYDTDSAMSSPVVPCAYKNASNNGSIESLAPPLPKTLPPALPVKTVFAQDSYYLPSSNNVGGHRSNEELDKNNLVSPHRGKDTVMPFPDLSAAPIDDSVFVSKCDVQLTERQAPYRNVSSLDSITDSGRGTVASNVGHIQNLVDKIGYIEKQLQVTNEETETEEESLFEWKVKASERGQQLDISSSENRLLKNEINRLEKELEEKNRYISTLDQWLHSFDDIFKNKDIKSDRDIIQQLQSDLAKVKGELTNSGQRKEDISQDPAALQTELRIKNRELSSKRQEVETLLSEIRCWQDECHTIETMRSNALDSLRALEVEALQLQDVHTDLSELRNEYNSLRGQMDKVKDLTEETVRLNNKVKDLENEQVSFQSIKEEYDNLRARFDEIESTKQKALTDVAPLKAKVARLSQKCEERNSLIKRLVNELQSKGNKSILLDELRRLEVAMTDVESDIEGPIPISPSRSQNHMAPHLHPSSRTSPGYWSSSSSLSDCRDLLSDTELISAPENKLPQRPRSAEHASRPSHHRRRHLPTKSDFHTPKKGSLTSVSHVEPQLFLALSDYNPQFFSKSDKPWLEIPLKEGDRVKVIGQLNHSGYYEAEVDNRVGLVPASYLQPLHHSPDWYHSAIKERRIQNLQSTPRNQEGSPEKIINMFQQLNRAQPSPITAGGSEIHFKPISGTHQTTQTKGEGQSTSTTQTFFNIPTLKSPPGAPDPPGNLKVQKIDGSTSLMLSWSLPTLNELNHSNSSQVTGYRIFCNGQICHQSHSPLLAKAVIENVPVAKQQKFSIQTMSANGLFSTSVSIMFNGTSTPSSGTDSDHDSDTDLSSILSKVHQGQGPRRQFIGVYDYNPQHNSPRNVTGPELSFRTGDEITVFGHQRPDGFYHAELNGKKGLVPARFIEELPSYSSNNSKSNKATYSSPVTTHFGSTENLNNHGNHNFLSPSQTHL